MFNCSGSDLQCVVCRLPMKEEEEEEEEEGRASVPEKRLMGCFIGRNTRQYDNDAIGVSCS